MRSSIVDSDGIFLKRRRSRRHPPQVLSDLDYVDDIALIEATIAKAQDLLSRVETTTKSKSMSSNCQLKKSFFMVQNRGRFQSLLQNR